MHAPYVYQMHLLFVRVASKGDWLPTQDRSLPDASPAGRAPIYLRITLNGRAHVATGIYATEAEWNVGSHRLRGKGIDAKLANDALLDWERRCTDAYRLLKPNNPSARRLKEEVVGVERGAPLTVMGLLEKFYAYNELPERNRAPKTLEGYRSCIFRMRGYLLHKRSKHLLAAEVDTAWLRGYEHYCLSTLKMKISTMKKHLGALCLAFRYATHHGLLALNPLLGFRTEATQPLLLPKHLNKDQLQQLADASYPEPRLKKIADAFLFLCYTGLSNVDYLRFDPTKHIHIAHGHEWIRMHRQKSAKPFSVLLLDEARHLLHYYAGHLPQLANKAFNRGLKVIGRVVGLPLSLTTGLARHTFSQRLRDLGLSDESTAAQAGHTIEIMNRHYSTVSELRIAQELERLKEVKANPSLLDQLREALKDPAQAELIRRVLGGSGLASG